MNPLRHKVAKNIKDNNLLHVGNTVIVGVSGGADSVALLDILYALKELQLRLVIAHLDHMLRGEDSDADAAFVRELALKYGLVFEMRSVNVHEFSLNNRLSLEEGGREARYAWFDEVASKHQAHAVALGHHADDQAETVLMRLLRGAGNTGLSGISPCSRGKYIRPLLCATRTEIEDYLNNRNIRVRTDSSNTDIRFLRNRVRHELLPYLRTYNPSISDRLVATAEILSADETLLEAVTEQAFHRLASVNGNEVIIDIPAVQCELSGLRFRIYRKAIHTAKGNLAHVTSRHLQHIDELVSSRKANSVINLPDGLKITKCYRTLSINTWTDGVHVEPIELVIEGPGIYPIPENRFLTVTMSQPPDDWKNVPSCKAYFDLDAAPFPWTVRTFRAGDRFTPLGMAGTRKIKDFFIDMKIPPKIRHDIPLLTSNGKILWIAGLRVAAHARITADTKDVIAAEILVYEP